MPTTRFRRRIPSRSWCMVLLTAVVLTTVVLGGAAPGVRADEPAKAVVIPGGKPCQGTLQIRGTTYKLDQAVAYSSIVLDENNINVLLSSAAIPVDKLKSALNDGNDDKFIFFKPNVKITRHADLRPRRDDEDHHDRSQGRRQEGGERDVLPRPIRQQQQFAVHQESRPRHDPER